MLARFAKQKPCRWRASASWGSPLELLRKQPLLCFSSTKAPSAQFVCMELAGQSWWLWPCTLVAGDSEDEADPLRSPPSLQGDHCIACYTLIRPFHTLVSMTSDPLHELLDSSNDTSLFRHISLWSKVKIFSAFGKLKRTCLGVLLPCMGLSCLFLISNARTRLGSSLMTETRQYPWWTWMQKSQTKY